MIGWSLALVSVIWGLATFWVFRHFSDRAALRVIGKRIYAHLLGIRLFSEEPALVWRAQKALLADNLRFLKLIAVPVLILCAPFGICYTRLDRIFGLRPLEVGHSAMVTVDYNNTVPVLRVPGGIVIETSPVTDLRTRQTSWRIRPLVSVHGNLEVVYPGGVVTRTIVAGERTLSSAIWYSEAGAPMIRVDYPPADVEIAGCSLPWLAWFLLLSSASAALFTVRPRRAYARASHPTTGSPIRSA